MKNATKAIAIVGTTLGTIACAAITIIVCMQIREDLDILRGVYKEFSPNDEDEA